MATQEDEPLMATMLNLVMWGPKRSIDITVLQAMAISDLFHLFSNKFKHLGHNTIWFCNLWGFSEQDDIRQKQHFTEQDRSTNDRD